MTDFTLNSNRFWIGLGSVIAQCFLSLLGIVLMPIRDKKIYKYIIQTMAAFAVGALLGNAIIHLIPQAAGVGDHHHTTCLNCDESGSKIPLILPVEFPAPNISATLNNSAQIAENGTSLHRHRRQIDITAANATIFNVTALDAHDDHQHKDHTTLYRMLVTLGAILLFFTYHSLTHQHNHHDGTPTTTNRRPVVTHSSDLSSSSATQWTTSQESKRKVDNHIYPKTASIAEPIGAATPETVSMTADSHADKISCCGQRVFGGFSRRACMVLLGDAIHNFADGVATAAAFAAGNEQGITTSVAIVCHETAHEVGDFAILLQSGMSFGGALLCNFLSSMSAILGYLTGAVIVGGVHQDSFVLWILALTAGIFLYIALVDLLPELIEQQKGRFLSFLVQLIAIGLGIAVVTVVELVASH